MPDWLDSIKNAIAGQAVGEMKLPSGGVVPFVTEVCRRA
jgi:hypothetical protein